MAEVVQRSVEQDQIGDQVVTTTTDGTVDPVARRATNKMIQVVYYIFGVIEALLALRVVLQLLGANQGNGFVDFIYNVTYPLVAPFYGVFGQTIQYGVARLELETLLAMVIYALLGYGIANLVRLAK